MNELVKLLKEFFVRLSIESPDVYKKIQKITGWVTSIIAVALIANASFGWNWGLIIIPILNISLTILLGGIASILTSVFLTAKTAVKDVVELEKKIKEKLEKKLKKQHNV